MQKRRTYGNSPGKKEEIKVNVTNNPAGIKSLGQESIGDK